MLLKHSFKYSTVCWESLYFWRVLCVRAVGEKSVLALTRWNNNNDDNNNSIIIVIVIIIIIIITQFLREGSCFNQHFSSVQLLNTSQKGLYHSAIYKPGKLKQRVGEVSCARPLSWQLKW